MNLTTGILVVLAIGTSLQRCSRTLAASLPRTVNKPLCVNEEFIFTVDNHCDLFIDGSKVDMHSLPNAKDWTNADRAKVQASASVIAITGTKNDDEEGGILASTNYFVTDASWKCTNKFYQGWAGVNFDDSAWPQATLIGVNGIGPWGSIRGIRDDANWIWTPGYNYDPNSDKIVFCRKKREDYCRCNGTGQSCVKSCKFLDDGAHRFLVDGNYQSCKGCEFFAKCSYGVFSDEQPCEGGGPFWDDILKECVNQSSTCKCCSNDETTTTAAITTYPTTKTTRATTVTTQPTTASNPPTSVKPTTSTTTTQATTVPTTTTEVITSTTMITSPTDTTTPSTKRTTVCTTGPTCITFCHGKADGVYQSCEGCHVYANCSRRKLKVLPCNSYGLYWDDNLKMCDNKSETCKRCPNEETTTAVTTNPTPAATTTSGICPTDRPHISSCCRTDDDSSCSNKLLYKFLCWMISHQP